MLVPVLLGLAALLSPLRKPQLEYRLSVAASDLSVIRVELTIHNAPAGLTLAAAAHPEYDDKYWRYLEGLEASGAAGESLIITRADSVLWRLDNPAGLVRVRYRVRFPAEPLPRAAWRPFLTATGGLVGGPHSFLYPLGLERQPALVTLVLPPGWRTGTALDSAGPASFAAPDLEALMESPFQVGRQSVWSFQVRGIPHRVFYWRLPDARPFDTTAFLGGIERIATGAIALFGSAPYRHYTFLYQDGAYGALEHPASVTLGATSENLASNPNAALFETAHEFFHTWNLLQIRPVEYRGLEYTTQPPVAELWFSEGLTIFYADLLMRRAGLLPARSTRIAHLESAMARYWNNSGNTRYSAEAISRVAYNAPPGSLGDHSASVHLLGELLGAMLDLRVRDASDGARSMDDVMRALNAGAGVGGRGFSSGDVRRAAEAVCRCGLGELFEGSILGAGPIDFTRYLGLIGLRATLTREASVDSAGRPLRDLRLFAYTRPGEDSLRLVITDPATAWGRAGLHSNEVLLAINGATPRDWPALRGFLSGLALGDTVSLRVRGAGGERTVRVPLTGYDHPVVRIDPLPGADARQVRLRRQWEAGS